MKLSKDNIRNQIRILKTNGDVSCEAVQYYIRFRDITDINRNVLSQLVDEIFVDSENNITVNFKFRNEIKKYCTTLEEN